MDVGQPFVLGVNYWPRRKAMYWWSQFDEGEVREEFSVIAELGLDVVRLFLLWDDWQPTPDTVDKDCLANFGKVADIAAEKGLGLDVTFFTGHMSGPNWSPGWLLGKREHKRRNHVRQLVSRGKVTKQEHRNPYHDPVALAAERLLLSTVVGAYKDHPGIWMWNLGNEPDLFDWPETREAGRAWVKEMCDLIRGIDPDHPVTCGLHAASLVEHNNMQIDDVYAETDIAVMHSYPMYSKVSRQPLDPDFVPFTCALTAALCGKPALMEEFGGCTTTAKKSETWNWIAYSKPRSQFMASEEDLAEYLRRCLPNLHDSGAQGAMVWCYADYDEELWDRPPCDQSKHERFFGLVRPDGSLKPHAQVIKEFAASKPTIKEIPEYAKLKITPEDFYNPKTTPASKLPGLYKTYLDQRGM
jgi:endo-1,4-beta-mannosidase